MLAAAGLLPMTRSATSPRRGSDALDGCSSAGSGGPMTAQTSPNSACTSATAGPRISTPVSRHGATPLRADPGVAHAQARDVSHATVDDEHLAVVARQPRQRPPRLQAG